MSKAIVLLSGGIDSAVCLGIAARNHNTVYPLHIDYGQQTAKVESDMALSQLNHIKSVHKGEFETKLMELNVVDYRRVFSHFAEGVASDEAEFVDEDGYMRGPDGRSTGYVPMRNLHLIATAGGFADHADADYIYLGAQGGDEAAYPDCRPGFMNATEKAINRSLGDNDSMELSTPLIHLSKAEVIRRGEEVGVNWRHTYSCYSAVDEIENPQPCGACPACVERKMAFEKAGIRDPHGPGEDND